MHSTFFLLSALTSLAAAVPTPASVAARSCTTLFPSILQVFSEIQPDTSFANSAGSTGDFLVKTEAHQTNRVLQAVGFRGIPASAYGCQLNLAFPATATIDQSPNLAVNVTTLALGNSQAITTPNDYTWNDIFAEGSPFSRGLFGTVGPFRAGQTVVVNSASCPKDLNGGGNLAYLFAIASNVQTDQAVFFNEKADALAPTGVYLTYGC